MTDSNLHGGRQQNDRTDAGFTARSGAQITGGARQGAAALQQSGQVTNEAIRRGYNAAAEIARQGHQASAEATGRVRETANETVRRSTRVVAEGQRQIAQEVARTFQEVSRKVVQAAHGTSEEVRRLAMLSHAAQGGVRDLQQGWAGLIEGVVQTNLRATQELLRLANPAAIIELQQRFARDYLDTMLQGTATLVRAVRRSADETLHPLEAQIAQRQQAQQSFRTAAE